MSKRGTPVEAICLFLYFNDFGIPEGRFQQVFPPKSFCVTFCFTRRFGRNSLEATPIPAQKSRRWIFRVSWFFVSFGDEFGCRRVWSSYFLHFCWSTLFKNYCKTKIVGECGVKEKKGVQKLLQNHCEVMWQRILQTR